MSSVNKLQHVQFSSLKSGSEPTKKLVAWNMTVLVYCIFSKAYNAMPKPNLAQLLKESFEAIDNIKNDVRPTKETDKNLGSSKKGKKKEKKARTICNKGEKKTKEMKAKAKAGKKNKAKAKAETVPFYEKSWHLDKVRFYNFLVKIKIIEQLRTRKLP